MDWSAILWFALLILFLMVESSTVSVVSIWFAAGSLVALVAGLFGAEFWLEAVLFLGVSVLTLAALRPMLKKFITPKLVKTNVDAVIGKTGIVTAAIDNLQNVGTVKLDGMEWSARSTDGNPVEKDRVVKVDRIEGVKVFVSAE